MTHAGAVQIPAFQSTFSTKYSKLPPPSIMNPMPHTYSIRSVQAKDEYNATVESYRDPLKPLGLPSHLM